MLDQARAGARLAARVREVPAVAAAGRRARRKCQDLLWRAVLLSRRARREVHEVDTGRAANCGDPMATQKGHTRRRSGFRCIVGGERAECVVRDSLAHRRLAGNALRDVQAMASRRILLTVDTSTTACAQTCLGPDTPTPHPTNRDEGSGSPPNYPKLRLSPKTPRQTQAPGEAPREAHLEPPKVFGEVSSLPWGRRWIQRSFVWYGLKSPNSGGALEILPSKHIATLCFSPSCCDKSLGVSFDSAEAMLEWMSP